MPVEITDLQPAHWPAVADVYREGIATGIATFETAIPTWEAWDQAHLPVPRLVASEAGRVVAWAAVSPVSRRAVYAGVAEVSIYVASRARGRGVGTQLLRALVDASDACGLWTLQAGILALNTTSIALHERCGFRMVGTRERIGRLGDAWRDVALMERRSHRIGVAGEAGSASHGVAADGHVPATG